MRALTINPGTADSLEVTELPDPEPGPAELLVEGLAVGVCGTDREIAQAEYGQAPPGHDRLVLGHESLGRVLTAPEGSGFTAGDLVVGVVRRPCPEPCGACAHDEFDNCRTGDYTERGIKGLDGYAAERWCVETDYAVALDPGLTDVGVLMEPTSVVAKAWEQVRRVGERAWYDPKVALVTGAGPIGLLGAMIGVQQGLDVHVLDVVEDGPKPDLVRRLGATYHHGDVDEVAGRLQPDVVIEATGVGSVVFAAMRNTAPFGVVCLTGIASAGHGIVVDVAGANREMVLENDAVIGSVNANLRHFRQAADALARADRAWLEGLISRRVPLDSFADAFTGRSDDVKVVITL
ncbi:glucose 1-dehydrogenase [Actinosynnema sp. NPDC053489]|uniref:glucose 1-dehydrogenase n=1 Tax=Actinosynnema sp. NPDC053489 TaxID=3363916 RepID=UPI0037C62B8E